MHPAFSFPENFRLELFALYFFSMNQTYSSLHVGTLEEGLSLESSLVSLGVLSTLFDLGNF
jgi:hypothetical protein